MSGTKLHPKFPRLCAARKQKSQRFRVFAGGTIRDDMLCEYTTKLHIPVHGIALLQMQLLYRPPTSTKYFHFLLETEKTELVGGRVDPTKKWRAV
jgi:hypothetical protein